MHLLQTRRFGNITFHCTLSYNMVKQLGVVGIHPSTVWTRHYLLLGVTTQMLSKLWAPFSCSFTICSVISARAVMSLEEFWIFKNSTGINIASQITFPSTMNWEFTVSCWYVYTQTMHLHMAVIPLRVFKCRLLRQIYMNIIRTTKATEKNTFLNIWCSIKKYFP